MKKINVVGEINLYTYEKVLNSVMEGNVSEEILLVINSTGGNVRTAFAIYDLLKSLNVKITTIAIGNCCSVATVLFALGSERFIAKNARYMLHQTNFCFSEKASLNSGKIRAISKSADNDEKIWKEILQESCSQNISEFLNNTFSSEEDVFLTAEETLILGLATSELSSFNRILEKA